MTPKRTRASSAHCLGENLTWGSAGTLRKTSQHSSSSTGSILRQASVGSNIMTCSSGGSRDFLRATASKSNEHLGSEIRIEGVGKGDGAARRFRVQKRPKLRKSWFEMLPLASTLSEATRSRYLRGVWGAHGGRPTLKFIPPISAAERYRPTKKNVLFLVYFLIFRLLAYLLIFRQNPTIRR